MAPPARSQGFSGGCQCGRVRYRVAAFGRASICHCRMCQKAFGGFIGPLVTAQDLVWTRGEPARFASSNLVKRGFCRDCGTPLTYEYDEGVDVSIGSLDDPEGAAPAIQVNPDDRLSFFGGLHALPVRQLSSADQMRAFLDRVVSRQHPDHDTETWPPPGRDEPPA